MLYNDSGDFQFPKLLTGKRRTLVTLAALVVCAGLVYAVYQIVNLNFSAPGDRGLALRAPAPPEDASRLATDLGIAQIKDTEHYVCLDSCAVIIDQSNRATLAIGLQLWNVKGPPLSGARIKIEAGSIVTCLGDNVAYHAMTDSLLFGDVDEKDHHGPFMPGKNFTFAIGAASPINVQNNIVSVKFRTRVYMNGGPASFVEFAACAKVRRLPLNDPGPANPTSLTPPPTRAGTM